MPLGVIEKMANQIVSFLKHINSECRCCSVKIIALVIYDRYVISKSTIACLQCASITTLKVCFPQKFASLQTYAICIASNCVFIGAVSNLFLESFWGKSLNILLCLLALQSATLNYCLIFYCVIKYPFCC